MSEAKTTRCSVCGSEVTDVERPRRPESPRRLPLSFQDATWHGTVPVDEHIGRLGLSLDVGDMTVRYALSVEDARHIAETLEFYLSKCSTNVHSDSSSGSPSSSESIPEEGMSVVPPARAHMADTAE